MHSQTNPAACLSCVWAFCRAHTQTACLCRLIMCLVLTSSLLLRRLTCQLPLWLLGSSHWRALG